METYLAPSVVASFTAVKRLSDASFASISVIPQFGQIAEAMSRSREISPAQPVLPAGSGLVWPFWLSFWKHPLAVVHDGRLYCVRYAFRSAAAFGSSYASTM